MENTKMKIRKRKKLIAKTTFDKKEAMRLMKIAYYKAQALNMRSYEYMQKEKLRLSTPKWDYVTNLIDKYKGMGLNNWESSLGKTLLGIYKKNKKAATEGLDVLNTNILEVIAKPEILLLAYKAIRGNKGALTEAAQLPFTALRELSGEQRLLYFKSIKFPDGFNLEDVFVTSKLLRKGLFPWGSSKRIYVKKPGRIGLRPITIPPFLDKVVQKSIALVLEAIYEPYFDKMNRSFGFRPNKGYKDAVFPFTTFICTGMRTAIEGDIKAAYDTVIREKLINILKKKIKDEKFLNLIRMRLNYDYVEKTENKQIRIRPTIGIPQGGIDSPYLFNIYMYELDVFIHKEIKEYIDKINIKYENKKRTEIKGFNLNLNSITENSKKVLSKNIGRAKRALRRNRPINLNNLLELKKDLYRNIKIMRKWHHYRNRINSHENTKRIIRFIYIRYADDWIILTNGNREIATTIKNKIALFLKEYLGLDLSEEKTLITNILKNPAHFLGFEVKGTARGPLYKMEHKRFKWEVIDGKRTKIPLIKEIRKKHNLMKRPGLLTWLAPDKQRLIDRFHMKGLCDKKGNPKEIGWISCLEPHIIIERFNAVIRGTIESYYPIIRNIRSLNRWIYILRFSCLKTLAQKYRSSIRKIFKKYGYRQHNTKDQTIRFTVKITNDKKTYEKDWILLTLNDVIKEIDKREVEIRKNHQSLADIFWMKEKGYIGDYELKSRKLPAITNKDYLEALSWVSLRTQATLDLPCARDGCTENVEMHHIKHVRKRAYKLIPDDDLTFKKIMALRNRKCIPLCRKCHRLIHSGDYKGSKLTKLIPKITVDNRIVHIESFIKTGQEYFGKNLEEKGWKLSSIKKIKEKLKRKK